MCVLFVSMLHDFLALLSSYIPSNSNCMLSSVCSFIVSVRIFPSLSEPFAHCAYYTCSCKQQHCKVIWSCCCGHSLSILMYGCEHQLPCLRSQVVRGLSLSQNLAARWIDCWAKWLVESMIILIVSWRGGSPWPCLNSLLWTHNLPQWGCVFTSIQLQPCKWSKTT